MDHSLLGFDIHSFFYTLNQLLFFLVVLFLILEDIRGHLGLIVRILVFLILLHIPLDDYCISHQRYYHRFLH